MQALKSQKVRARRIVRMSLGFSGFSAPDGSLVLQAVRPAGATVSKPRVVKVTASAERVEAPKQVAVAIAAAALLGLSNVDAAQADIAGLTPCSDSKAYAKRLKNEVKGLNKRLKQVRSPVLVTGGLDLRICHRVECIDPLSA